MWAIRRASVHLRNRCLSLETSRICAVKSEIRSCYFECENFVAEFTQSQVRRRFHNTSEMKFAFSLKDDNGVLKDSSSRLETRHDDESISESDHSVDELECEKKSPKTGAISGLAEVLRSSAAEKASEVLDEWVEAGNEVTQTEVSSTVQFLINRKLFVTAFKLYEWLESRQKIEFTEKDYAYRVDIIAKVRGIVKAEEYIQHIPESVRTEIVYNSLLSNYVVATDVYKSEKLFNKMKDLFPLTVISCNTILLLYTKRKRRAHPKKIADIMNFMLKANIKPSNVTYQILIDVKGQSGNIWEMERIFEMMKSNGVEPSLDIRASMAKYYAASGLKVKAEAVLKDMEGGDLIKNRAACYYLLPVYASLGRGDEVGRIWKEHESNSSLGECVAALKAFGQLERFKDAEEILRRSPSSYLYSILLNVYADHKMVTKGEDLFRRMRESGVPIHMRAWHALMKLYMGVGEVEKADTALDEAIKLRNGRLNYASFMKILEGYAARGDVHSAEKLFMKMREAGCTRRPRPYYSLLYAYINSKTQPADGFEKRLKEDNVVPDKKLARLLARANACQASAMV